MLGLFRPTRLAAIAAAAVMLAAAAPAPSYAQTGAVRVTVTRVGFIVGVGGGNGVLVYKGTSYPLSVGGVSVGTFGVAQADLVGRAYRLRRPSDIAGTYTAVSAGVAIAGGARTARLQNSNGVVLELRGRQVGLELSLDLSGMTITMR